MTRADFITEMLELWKELLEDDKVEAIHPKIEAAIEVLTYTYNAKELGIDA